MICVLWRYVATARISRMLSCILWKTYSWDVKLHLRKMQIKYYYDGAFTYYVPATLLVLASISFPTKLLASPKSEIFGFSS